MGGRRTVTVSKTRSSRAALENGEEGGRGYVNLEEEEHRYPAENFTYGSRYRGADDVREQFLHVQPNTWEEAVDMPRF